jgi:hypothetical protein
MILPIIIHVSCKNSKPPNPYGQLLDGLSDQFQYILSEPAYDLRSEEAINGLLITLDTAKNKAYCVFEDVDDPRIFAKLSYLNGIGVDVRVAMDEDNRLGLGYKQFAEFLPTIGENKKLWSGNKGEGQVYLNLCFVDGVRTYFSSAPFTKIGLSASPFISGYIQSNEDGISKKFGSSVDLLINGSFGATKQRLNQRNHWLFGNIDIGLYFAPEEDPVSFIAKRLPDATLSQEVFTTEFYSNKRNSGTSNRITEDLAYEILNSTAPVKNIIVSTAADLNPDPDAVGNCEFNNYLGLSCDKSKTAGTSGDSPRRENSSFYLRKNSISPKIYGNSRSKHSLSVILLDSGQPSNKTMIGSMPLSSRSDSSHDGFMFVFEDRQNVDRISSFYSMLQRGSLFENGTVGRSDLNFLSIVITEINWMGSMSATTKNSTSEWIELYNNLSEPVNLSDWKVQCGRSGSFSTLFTFPKRTIIGAKQYFVVENDDVQSVKEPNLRLSFGSANAIGDTRTDQCRVLDSISRIIDVAGVSGIPFVELPETFGKIDVEGKINRTMERKQTNLAGENISNWKTNSNIRYYDNYNMGDSYFERTFGSPGYASSTSQIIPTSPRSPARDLVINEVSRNSSDTYVEIYNPTDATIDLSTSDVYLNRSSNCSISSGSWSESLLLSANIPAKGYYLFARTGHASSGIADRIDLGTLSSTYCIALTIGDSTSGLNHPAMIDFVNLGANSISSNGGTFVTDVVSQRCPNGKKTTVYSNSSDFVIANTISPRSENVCP